MLTKQGDFTKEAADLPDVPSPNMTPAEIKSHFQTPVDELKTAHNALVDELVASTGAAELGAKETDGTTSTVQALLSKRGNDLKAHKEAVVLDHPDKSVTTAKINDKAVTSVKIGDKEVKTINLDDSSVTNVKLAPGITGDKIANGQISRGHIIPGAIGTNELDPSITSQPKTEFEIQAKFDSLDSKLAQIAINITMPPYNASTNGNDVSAIINQAITDANNRGGGKVFIPSSSQSYMIDALTSILLKDNVTLELAENATLQTIQNSADTYHLIKAENVSNIKIIGGNLIGDRDLHTDSTGKVWKQWFPSTVYAVDDIIFADSKGYKCTVAGTSGTTIPTHTSGTATDGSVTWQHYVVNVGEWGHGIVLRGCTNVEIENVRVSNCWGDGLLISGNTNQSYCEDVKIRNFYSDNNRRQGISVASVKKLNMDNIHLTNTNGTAPNAGLDLEPDADTQFLEGIRINNLYTENNAGSGILIYLVNFVNAGVKNTIDIVITNHKDVGSGAAVGIFRHRGEIGELRGNVIFNNPIWEKNESTVCTINWYADDTSWVKINNPTIIDPNTSGGVFVSGYSAIRVKPRYASDIHPVGNVEINRPNIYSVDGYTAPRSFYFEKSTGGIKKILVSDPIKVQNETNVYVGYSGVTVKDAYGILKDNFTGTSRNIGDSYSSLWTNEGNPYAATINLNALIEPSYPEFTIECRVNSLEIKPDANSTIRPLSTVSGESVIITEGQRITLKRISLTKWQVTNYIQ